MANKNTSIYTTTHLTRLFKTIFYGLDSETLNTLRQVAETRKYPANTVLVRQGDKGNRFYVVIDGRVRFTQRAEDNGVEEELGICSSGQYFGEMALLDDTPRAATCTTITETTLLEITAEKFKELAKSSPAIAYSLTNNILKNLRQNDARAIDTLMAKNEELATAYAELQSAQLALIKHETMRRELEIASEVQQSFLPATLPQFDDYQFAAHLEFERRAGGNFYDVVQLDNDHIAILLGDIADKGVHASLFMAVTRTLFHLEGQRSLSPAEVAAAVNKNMFAVSTRNDIFVMAFYGVLHRPSGKLTYILAGHERPLLVRADAAVEELIGSGRFIGMTADFELQENSVELKAGDTLMIFSSGVTNSINAYGNPYGNERLKQILAEKVEASALVLINDILADLNRWQADHAVNKDDVALLVATISN